MSLYGLHTGFDAPIGSLAAEVTRLGFTRHRLEVMHASNETLAEMVSESLIAGADPLVVIWDVGRLPVLTGRDAEWKNELDGDLPPADYRRELEDAVRVAVDCGVRLWGGVISNLDGDSLSWLNDVKGDGWPAGLHGITAHRYGDGTFEHPHRGFSSRDAEVKWLRAAAAGLPMQITEFGYPTDAKGLSEDQAALEIRKEWDFWTRHQIPAYLYQVNDGPGWAAIDHYGIRRTDGTWKPAAYTVPTMAQETDTMNATFVLHRRDLIPLGNGKFKARYPTGSPDTIMSVQPGGEIQTRPIDQVGAWETITDDGTRAVFEQVDGGVYAFPLVG